MSASSQAGIPGDDASVWLRYAREDLETARGMVELSVGVARQACWLAQQAAEKALKGLLVVLGERFPRTHDLDLLRTLLPLDTHAKSSPDDVSELSEWAVASRYPGNGPEPTWNDANRAVDGATEVLKAVDADMLERRFGPDV